MLPGDMTGKESYYTVYAGHEVMYHVSTMLPYSKDNPQQLERKRHIGNDIVNIVYTDDLDAIDSFNPNCIRSQFTRKFSKIHGRHLFSISTSLLLGVKLDLNLTGVVQTNMDEFSRTLTN